MRIPLARKVPRDNAASVPPSSQSAWLRLMIAAAVAISLVSLTQMPVQHYSTALSVGIFESSAQVEERADGSQDALGKIRGALADIDKASATIREAIAEMVQDEPLAATSSTESRSNRNATLGRMREALASDERSQSAPAAQVETGSEKQANSAQSAISVASSPLPVAAGVSSPAGSKLTSSPLDDVVRMLLPKDQAETYIRQNPGTDFRFYLYTLAGQYTWQNISACIDRRFKSPSNCDWGSSICGEVNATSAVYSKRRFNRNGDVVLAKIFEEYNGPLKTYDPTKADIFIVPYASAGNCECRAKHPRCGKDIPSEEIAELVGGLAYLNASTLDRHLFTVSNIFPDMHPFFKRIENAPLATTNGPNYNCGKKDIGSTLCGQITMPYVNANPETQPNVLPNYQKGIDERKFAMSAFVSKKISGNSYLRAGFFDAVENMTKAEIGGLPIFVNGLSKRSLSNEYEIMSTYRDSIFCPCLRGDEPPQKRLFDAMLSGCIPVVMQFPNHAKDEFHSHFAHGATSTRQTYPFSKGTFFNSSDFGINYHDLVVAVNETCGISCLIPTLDDLLLNHLDTVRAKQRTVVKFAHLFSFGMEKNGLQQADAVSALLVQARHYVNIKYGRPKRQLLAKATA